MARPARLGIAFVGAATAILALSGGTTTAPVTPEGPPDKPRPFTGVATVGSGGVAASIDPFGSVVNMRSPGPAGKPVIETPLDQQRTGTVPPTNGIVLRAAADGKPPRPLWRASAVGQEYVPGSNVLVTRAEVAGSEVRAVDAIEPGRPAFVRLVDVAGSGPEAAASRGGVARRSDPAAARREPVRGAARRREAARGEAEGAVRLTITVSFDFGEAGRRITIDPGAGRFSVQVGDSAITCRAAPAATIGHDGDHFSIGWRSRSELRASLMCGLEGVLPPLDAERVIADAIAGDRQWLSRARGLSGEAPPWARALYRRSLLALRSLTDPTTGAVPAAMRDYWHYIWPRDAATASLALSSAGYRTEARAIASFLEEVEVERAARFTLEGLPVEDGREPQGDGQGWLQVARRAGGLPRERLDSSGWRDGGDYGERRDDSGDYLANAIAAGVPSPQIAHEFRDGKVLVRESMSPGSALDTATAWAVRPFPRPALSDLARRTLLRLVEEEAGPYGLRPATDWPGHDPWTAVTASVGWALAALGERERALELARAIRDSATPLGVLPERVDAESGDPRSTMPLTWSHALASLMIRELWPAGRARDGR